MPRVPERPEAGQQPTRSPRRATPPLALVGELPAVIAPYAEAMQLDRTQVDLIKRTICPPDTNDDELALFLHECKRRGVHPMDRAVVMQKRNDRHHPGQKRVVFMTTITYKRSRAEDTGVYAGSDDIEYGPPFDRSKPDVPSWAKATVYKIVGGQRCPFTARVFWKEYYPVHGDSTWMWDRMPQNQLGKCAESKALEKAFPAKLGDMPVEEELQRGDEDAAPDEAPEAPDVVDGVAEAAPPTDGFVADDAAAPAAADAAADEDRWAVASLKTGTLQGRNVWQLIATNPVGEEAMVYTAIPAIASQLQRLQEQDREFTMTWAEKDGYDDLVAITPL
jgi:phage recombination protein Bet